MTKIILISVVNAVLLFGIPARAQSIPAIAPKVERMEDRWENAVRSHDYAAPAGIFSDDFANTSATGKFLKKVEYLSTIRNALPHIKSLVVRDRAIRIYATTAVVTGRYRVSTEEQGNVTVENGRFTDVWVKTQHDWRCVAAHSSLLSR